MDGIFFCTDELDEVFAAGNTIELSLSIPKKYLTLYDDCDEIVKRIHCTDIIIELHFGGQTEIVRFDENGRYNNVIDIVDQCLP